MNAKAADIPEESLLAASPGFKSWLLENQCSLALSSFERSRLFFIGLTDKGGLWAHERQLENCRSVWARGDQIWLSTLYQIWSFTNVLPAGTVYKENGSDRLYCPRISFVTGALNAHEIEVDAKGRVIFVNTQYSCLAVPDIHNSFRPLWRPDFVTELVPEDRCHLNGMAMGGGVVRYVTARTKSDAPKGWKKDQAKGGLLISVQDNQIVTDQLSMPHSPRIHNGKLWLLNTGTCEFGTIDVQSGKFEPVCHCPGYARGMTLIGDWAVIGLSRPRKDDGFKKLPLAKIFERQKSEPQCGLIIVDLRTGNIAHWLRFQHTIKEVTNVTVISRVRQPSMLGFKNQDEAAGFIKLPGDCS